jgi:hypothetical protein
MNPNLKKEVEKELSEVREQLTKLKQREFALLLLIESPQKRGPGRPLGWRKPESKPKQKRTPAKAMHEAIMQTLPSGKKLTNAEIRSLLKPTYPYALTSELVRNALSDLKTETPPKVFSEGSGISTVYWRE